MSEPHDTAMPASDTGPAIPAPRRYRMIALPLGGVLIILIAIVALAPFWAPALGPLLPWGIAPARPDALLAQRLDRLEAARQEERQQERQQERQSTAQAAAALPQLDRRIAALEAKPAVPAVPAVVASDIAEIRQQLAKLSAAVADLNTRTAAVEKAAQAQTAQTAADSTDTALVLALLQIRDAVEVARPFAAEYDAFAALARTRPEIAAAAAPLAEPARTGVASHAALAARLRSLAGTIATAPAPTLAPAAEPGWGEAALARLRALVTIRRIDGAGQSGPEAAVNDAERSLAAGDLAAAIAALDRLTGAPGEAARPWLQMARERLAVEAALHRIAALMTARLGDAANAPAGAAAAH